jgi:hypothetical protein
MTTERNLSKKTRPPTSNKVIKVSLCIQILGKNGRRSCIGGWLWWMSLLDFSTMLPYTGVAGVSGESSYQAEEG